jgi:hypothetical protein
MKEHQAMSTSGSGASSLAEVKAAAESLLQRAASDDVLESGLFTYGVNRVVIHVKSGENEINVEITGPDHSHPHMDDDDDPWEDEIDDDDD